MPSMRYCAPALLRKVTLSFVGVLVACSSGCVTDPSLPQVAGVVWQPDTATISPHGNWERLGATELLVQWTAVDGVAFVADAGMPSVATPPDWQRIASEPWARDVILGLAGRFDETAARADLDNLGQQSLRLAALATPLHVSGWYFPVEIDPTWVEASSMKALLARLPRPLWISVYDSANLGPNVLVEKLSKWLPSDVGVFFQDGVGVHAREARVARQYADVMAKKLGKDRVRIIAEAFRPQVGGGFRSATVEELRPQLQTYRSYKIYLFDGPHYMNAQLVNQLLAP